MLFGVGNQSNEAVDQLVIRGGFSGGQHVDKLAVGLVHFVHVQHQVVRPGEGGLQVQGGGVGHVELGLSGCAGIIVDAFWPWLIGVRFQLIVLIGVRFQLILRVMCQSHAGLPTTVGSSAAHRSGAATFATQADPPCSAS